MPTRTFDARLFFIMSGMQPESGYKSYILRVWQVERDVQLTMVAALEDCQTNERQVHNAGITWTLTFTESGLTIAPNDGSPNAFVLDANGNLTLAGAVIESSDVNVKEYFAPVDSAAVLAALVLTLAQE